MLRNILSFLAFIFLAPHCFAQSDWQVVDTGAFTISLPPGWEFKPEIVDDSFVGNFYGEGITLRFDCGLYSNSLNDYAGKDYLVTKEIINSHRAKIVNAKAEKGLVGMYLQNKLVMNQWVALSIVSNKDLTFNQRQLVLKIFRSIKFKKRE